MWLTQPGQFDFDQQQALSTALLFELLQFVAVLLLVSAAVVLVIYLVGLVLLCRDENRAAAQRRSVHASRQPSTTTPKQPRRLRPARHSRQKFLQQKERP
jgi:uncharacterized membrane protein